MISLFERFRQPKAKPDVSDLDKEEIDLLLGMIAKAKEISQGRVYVDDLLSKEFPNAERLSKQLTSQVAELLAAQVEDHPELIQAFPIEEEVETFNRTGKRVAPSSRALIRSAFLGTAAPPMRLREETQLTGEEDKITTAELAVVTTFDPGALTTKELPRMLSWLTSLTMVDSATLSQELQRKGYGIETFKKKLYLLQQGNHGTNLLELDIPDMGSSPESIRSFLVQVADAVSQSGDAVDDGTHMPIDIRKEVAIGQLLDRQQTELVVPALADVMLGYRRTLNSENEKKKYVELRERFRKRDQQVKKVSQLSQLLEEDTYQEEEEPGDYIFEGIVLSQRSVPDRKTLPKHQSPLSQVMTMKR